MSVKGPLPAVVEDGLSSVNVGLSPPTISKITKFEKTPPFESGVKTTTLASPGVARSELGIVAVNRVLLTKLVSRGWPFHSATEAPAAAPARFDAPSLKPLPSSVSVKPLSPSWALFGVRLINLGAAAFAGKFKKLY